jgi:hypothetical protein
VADIGDEFVGEDRDQRWHVSRSVPVAFIVSMLIYTIAQAATAAWFASAMNYRVEAIEKAQALLMPTAATQGERLTRVEEKLEGVKAGIADIKVLLTAQDARSFNSGGGAKPNR